jgi:DNA-binding CsgD family transcriptional regulator
LRAGRQPQKCGTFFDEAAQFGIRYGFTIPIKDRQNRIAAVTFATDERRPAFGRSVAAYSSGLHLMALFFHRQACTAFDPSRVIAGAKLSPRQLECLEWAAQGKSAWETSRIIGVSRRTVAFHLETAKARLEVRSISQAVAKLIAERPRG